MLISQNPAVFALELISIRKEKLSTTLLINGWINRTEIIDNFYLVFNGVIKLLQRK